MQPVSAALASPPPIPPARDPNRNSAVETAQVPLTVPARDWTPHPALPEAAVLTSAGASPHMAPAPEGQTDVHTLALSSVGPGKQTGGRVSDSAVQKGLQCVRCLT